MILELALDFVTKKNKNKRQKHYFQYKKNRHKNLVLCIHKLLQYNKY